MRKEPKKGRKETCYEFLCPYKKSGLYKQGKMMYRPKTLATYKNGLFFLPML